MDSASFEQTVLALLGEIKESLEELKKAKSPERYLTLKEAADYLRTSPCKLYRDAEKYGGVKIGGRWRYDRREIDRRIEEARHASLQRRAPEEAALEGIFDEEKSPSLGEGGQEGTQEGPLDLLVDPDIVTFTHLSEWAVRRWSEFGQEDDWINRQAKEQT